MRVVPPPNAQSAPQEDFERRLFEAMCEIRQELAESEDRVVKRLAKESKDLRKAIADKGAYTDESARIARLHQDFELERAQRKGLEEAFKREWAEADERLEAAVVGLKEHNTQLNATVAGACESQVKELTDRLLELALCLEGTLAQERDAWVKGLTELEGRVDLLVEDARFARRPGPGQNCTALGEAVGWRDEAGEVPTGTATPLAQDELCVDVVTPSKTVAAPIGERLKQQLALCERLSGGLQEVSKANSSRARGLAEVLELAKRGAWPLSGGARG